MEGKIHPSKTSQDQQSLMPGEHSIRDDEPRRGNEHQLGLESLKSRSVLLVSRHRRRARARRNNSSIIVSLHREEKGGVESVICLPCQCYFVLNLIAFRSWLMSESTKTTRRCSSWTSRFFFFFSTPEVRITTACRQMTNRASRCIFNFFRVGVTRARANRSIIIGKESLLSPMFSQLSLYYQTSVDNFVCSTVEGFTLSRRRMTCYLRPMETSVTLFSKIFLLCS